MLFIDELDKNDMHDEGETALAQAGVPVALVGPGVNDQRLSDTDAEGQFMFSDLRAGPYQLIVPIGAQVAAALAANDLAYGGPPTGYGFALAVGEAKTQAVPFDITHTTVNFTVSLKSGEETGDALPGATVTLYSDAAGTTKVGGGETGEDGSVAIKVTRAGTTGNMVHAGVSADGYAVADGMTAVPWNPQLPATVGANANDIVNLNVDVTVSGATITTEYGGGDALAGWAISVMMGDSAAADAPEALDDDGNAAFTATVASVPASFTFAVADDQADAMDGGENYAAEPATYMHTGLMLAGTQDAGMIEVAYTTQTLKVYVHHERDQVEGYTGNVLGGDERDDGKVSVDIRYINDSGRSRAFQNADSIDVDGPTKGAWTFSNVPADMNVVVEAEDGQDEDDDDYQAIMVLDDGAHSDELAAYRDTDANGITGGHFGAMGGYSHTVELCPLQATSPQDHGECSSFAYVSAYQVSGTVTKETVEMDDADDFEAEEEEDTVEGITVSLTPVDGKNLAGEEQSSTTAKKDDDDTDDLDETKDFAFEDVAAGAYTLGLPEGWEANGGDADDLFDPLGDDVVALDITPSTATVYGFVVDEDGFAVDSATVTANAESTLTDEHGRFLMEGIKSETRTISRAKVTGIFVEASIAGIGKASVTLAFAANSVTQVTKDGNDLALSAAAQTASISGSVSASGSAAPIAGAKVEVSYDGGGFVAPENKNAKSKGATKNDIHVTGTDGTYTVMVKGQDVGDGVSIRVSKDDLSFIPEQIDDIPAHAGSEVSGFNFTGFVNATITGKVVRPGGGPMSGVTVTATEAGEDDAEATDSDVTGRTGSFSLSVPFDRYMIEASAGEDDITRFTYPDDEQDVRVAPGQRVSFGNITGKSVNARSISTERVKNEDGSYDTDGNVDISWRFDNVAGFTSIGHQIDTCVEDCADEGTMWATNVSFTPATDDDSEDAAEGTRAGTFTAPTDSDSDLGFSVRIRVTAMEDQEREGVSAVRTVGRVDSSPSKITAVRDTEEGATVDSLTVNWEASTNTRTVTRVVVTVDLGAAGTHSLIAAGGNALTDDATSMWIDVGNFSQAGWTIAGSAQTLNVTEADLRKALEVRVETRQAMEFDDDEEEVWNATSTVEVDADPEDAG